MVAVLCWFGVKYLVGMRNLGYEDSAIGTMRTLIQNENNFAQSHPNIGYSCKLRDITDNQSIVNGSWNGFVFELNRCMPAKGRNATATYLLTARPLHSEAPAFCADESGILKVDNNASVANCLKDGDPI